MTGSEAGEVLSGEGISTGIGRTRDMAGANHEVAVSADKEELAQEGHMVGALACVEVDDSGDCFVICVEADTLTAPPVTPGFACYTDWVQLLEHNAQW